MACEIAGAEYSFSEYGASHWAAMKNNNTCPDLVIDPTFVHYLPDKTARIMSMNQVKLRHLKKFFASESTKGIEDIDVRISRDILFAVSRRQIYDEQRSEYAEAEKTCNPSIKEMRRVHRCWSSKVSCNYLTSGDMKCLANHFKYQIQAKRIFKT